MSLSPTSLVLRRRRTQPAGTAVFPLDNSPLGTDSLVNILFERRGWTTERLAEIDSPDHPELLDMDLMVQALREVHVSGEQIVVMPDYDMDGISAGVLGWAGLAELGFNVEVYVPDYRDGHDILPVAIDKLKAQFPAATTIITCDAGINSHSGIARAHAHGLKVLVTDHHTQEPGSTITADVAVNPCRIDDPYPNKGICGAFVMWQVLDAYARTHVHHKVRSINLLRLFAGLGTVSDVMPLLFENRQLVRDSVAIARSLHVPVPAADTVTVYEPDNALLLSILRAEGHDPRYLSAFEGFAVMLKAFREHGQLEVELDDDKNPVLDPAGNPVLVRRRGPLREVDDLSEEFYGFYVAPTFNAVRRSGGDMADAFGIFTAAGQDAKYQHAVNLIENNYARREQVEIFHDELMASLDAGEQPLAPWVWVSDARSGMFGLLANRLMSELGHPVAVIGRPQGPKHPRGGSMRAPGWFDIITRMGDGLGFNVQGHQQACGLYLESQARTEEFAQLLAQEVDLVITQATLSGETLGEETPDLVLGDHDEADASLSQHEDLVELGLAVEALAPFGQGFPPPEIELVLDLSRCTLGTVGSKDNHLRITTPSGVKVYWWSAVEDHFQTLAELAANSTPVRLRTSLRINEYMDHLSPQFTIRRLLTEEG